MSEPPRRRRAAANIRPDELRRTRRDTREGLDWLGKPPEIRAGLVYRVVRGVAHGFAHGVCGLRVDARGRENLPRGGYLLVAAVHRGWLDPLLALEAVPIEPRVWTLGSGPSVFDRPWKERFFRLVGGVLPVWRGGIGIDVHVASSRAVVERGGVFLTFPEGTIGGPPDRVTSFRHGVFVIALRTGAPIVPLAVAGSDVLYRGKRLATRILPPMTMAELVGDAWAGTPAAGSREEIAAARIAAGRLEEILGETVAEIYPGTIDPPGPRRWTWLTGFLRPRPHA